MFHSALRQTWVKHWEDLQSHLQQRANIRKKNFQDRKWANKKVQNTLLRSSNSMTFHDYFHDPLEFSMAFSLAVTFENFQNFPCFSIYFLTLNSSTDTNSSVHQNVCHSHCLVLLILSCPCFVICSDQSTKQKFHFPRTNY